VKHALHFRQVLAEVLIVWVLIDKLLYAGVTMMYPPTTRARVCSHWYTY